MPLNCDISQTDEAEFAILPSSELTPMSNAELQMGLECGALDIGQVNTVFRLAFSNFNIVRNCLLAIRSIFNEPDQNPNAVTLMTNGNGTVELGYVINTP